LTVPFARYVVMHQHEISFPFKRYQVQPVWRADRPQRGRYREFYQCDVDVVGSPSLMYEAEMVQIYDEVFAKLGLKVIIKVNSRKILEGISEVIGVQDQFMDFTVALDKLDKIGFEGVTKEMLSRGIDQSAISKLEKLLAMNRLEELQEALQSSEKGMLGVSELHTLHQYLDHREVKNKLQFDATLARGLNYYTGCIFEVIIDSEHYEGVKMGSIGGGGRYDNLTSNFGLKDVSGVGVSFGAERIYDLMEELQLFPSITEGKIKTLFLSFDLEAHHFAFQCVGRLREKGIACDIYPDPTTKMKKQMKYANDRNVPTVILIGEEEMASGLLSYKDMVTGEQLRLSIDDIEKCLS
ncbi:MAG: histidine--tRNA ligase, partial [Saprospiraceae bacterium]|nr:histidine--tRNA ligase [Saprospiraceae bacterium]